MKKLLIIALAVSALCVLLAGPSFADEAIKDEAKKAEIPIGQKVFTEAKCQMCHTVYSAGIGEPPAEDVKAEETEEAEEGPPDLSLTGTGRTAEWLSLFLQKKEALNEKKHMLAFKGTDVELAKMVSWLLTLKAPEVEAAPAKTSKVEKACGAAAEEAPEGEAAKKGHDCRSVCSARKADKDAGTEGKKGE